ncbi:MAG: hypothetical protein ACRERD_05375 [Candidatus Binatia bacterium]
MAKPDKTGQNPTLSIEQANAIDLLVVGKSDQEVAEAIGKTRQTVCNWRLYHPLFQAVLNQRRQTVWSGAADKLRSLLPQALAVIERALTQEHNLKVALEIVKLAGVQLDSIGPQDPQKIVAQEARARDTAVLLSLGGVDPQFVWQELLEKAAAETP